MTEYTQIITWLQAKLPLVVVGLFGGVAAEVIRSEESKINFRIKYMVVYAVSSLLVVGFIDDYNLEIGYEISCAIIGGFMSKEILAFAVSKFKKKIGVDGKDGNDI